MSSLRSFHMVFILLAIIGADVFGAWAIRHYRDGGEFAMLLMGIVSLLGGVGLIVYAWLLVRKLDARNHPLHNAIRSKGRDKWPGYNESRYTR